MSRPTTTMSVKFQAQTGSTFMCLRLYRNNFMLRSVYFRSLVNLENKARVRVPLVIILLACEQAPVGDSRVQSRANGMNR